MDRDQTRQREHYQGEHFEDESAYRQGHDRMTYRSQDRQRQGGQTDMERSGTGASGMTRSGGTGGDWQGFVVPYRYYGPGYAGLGYYAVYYQGGAGQGEEGDTSQGFDQRNVQYGQGQGAGAAWQPGRSQGGRQSERSGGQTQNQGGHWQNEGSQWGNQSIGQWRSQSGGGYAGRGPKGYRRSDDRIREEISDQFMDNDELDASEIEVLVVEGIVTLTGTVPDRHSKRLAEDIAESGSGVRDVMNQLKVEDQGRGGTASSSSTSGATRSSSGTRSTATTGSRPRSGKASVTSTSGSSGSEARQPVGSTTGGATDGSTGNGSNRDQSTRDSGSQSR
jgi:osmotically-inducible protein OsmY